MGERLAASRLPDRDATRMAAKPPVLRHKWPSMLNCRCENQSIGRIAGEGIGKRCGCGRDRGRKYSGSHLGRESFEPRADGYGYRNAPGVCHPGQLKPSDGGYSEFVGGCHRLNRLSAEALRLRGPPVDDVGVQQDSRHGTFQTSPVEKRSSSFAVLVVTPANLPLSACGPLAGVRRATARPCRVISISSPPSTSSSKARSFAFASVAVILLVI